MRRLPLLLALATAITAISPAVAGAVTLATGPHGRALEVWASPAGLQFSERTNGRSFSPATTIAPGKAYPLFAAFGPGGSAIVLADDGVGAPVSRLVELRRAVGATTFAPATVIGQPGVRVLDAASNAGGDLAVLVREGAGRPVLLTAAAGGALGGPQQMTSDTDDVAIAVGGDGRVAVVYYDFPSRSMNVRTGSVSSPLGAPHILAANVLFSDVAAAIDDDGNATVAFARGDGVHNTRPAELVVARAAPGRRFGALRVAGLGGAEILGSGFATLDLAAGGDTTALIADPNDADGRLTITLAHGGGRFGPVERPSVRGTGQVRAPGWLDGSSVAVDRAGDVLIAYGYGSYANAVHVSEHRAGRAGFSAPRVVSTLGQGSGAPVAALTSDRMPLVAWDTIAGDQRRTTSIDGRRPDLSPPRATVTLLPDAAATLRSTNAFGLRIRCSEACFAQVRATLRTSNGRRIQGSHALLRAGRSIVRRFTFDPGKRDVRAGDGARLRVTVDVENGSGASREQVAQLTLRPGH